MASVFLRNGQDTWTAKVKDYRGRWIQVPTTAGTKAEARRLAEDLERKYERQRLGLEPRPGIEKELTFGELMDWWWERHGCRLRSTTIKLFLEKHLRKPLGDVPIRDVTSERFDRLLASKEKTLAPRSVNHIRAVVHRMFKLASQPGVGIWSGLNPIAAVPRRRVARRLPTFLKYDEVPRVLMALGGKWQAVVATAVYTGLRRGEIFALRKSDIDWEEQTLQVCKSWEADSTKDGKPALIPIADGLVPFLRAAAKASPSRYLFPRPDGAMHDREVNADRNLRSALGRAGVVEGYEHRCRKQGCGFKEQRPTADQGKCPRCKRSLWPVAIPRKVRFHDLRHTTATLLLKEGVSLPVVQRILRHSDPKLTTETYGHLELADMRAALGLLSFGVKPQAKPFGALVVQGPETQKEEGRDGPGIQSNIAAFRKSGRQDLNLRPLGPEPDVGSVPTVGGTGMSSQPLDDTGVEATASVEGLLQDPPNGRDGNASADQVAADLRRTEFLRPELLLPVSAVAERLGVSKATVHDAINAGELRWVLFGSVRRVRPEDLEAYGRARSASRPPADEDWCTVADLVRASGFSRSQAYKLAERENLPFRVFAGTRYFRTKDIGAFLRTKKNSPGTPS